MIGGVAPGVYVAENCGATLVAIPRVMLAKGGIFVPVARGGCVAVRFEKRTRKSKRNRGRGARQKHKPPEKQSHWKHLVV